MFVYIIIIINYQINNLNVKNKTKTHVVILPKNVTALQFKKQNFENLNQGKQIVEKNISSNKTSFYKNTLNGVQTQRQQPYPVLFN